MPRTKASESSPAQAEKVPEKLEQKTRSLEKRLLLRHFLSKALEIRRAEAAAEQERRNLAMKEFIRLPTTSSPTQPSSKTEGQKQVPSVISVVEQARQNAVVEQKSQPEDLLSADSEDLIDLSNDFKTLPTQPWMTGINTFKDSYGLQGLSIPQQAIPGIAHGVESHISGQQTGLSEEKNLQPSQSSFQPETLGLGVSEIDTQRRLANTMAKLETPKHPQMVSYFPAPNARKIDTDAQSFATGYSLETSPTTTATPSIFSHASTLSSTMNSSVSGITEAELHERSAKVQMPGSPVLPSQDLRQNTMAPSSIERPGQSTSGHRDTSFTPTMSTNFTDTGSNSSATNQALVGDQGSLLLPRPLSRSISDSVTHQPNTTELPLQGIDEPDANGFPWIVQAARDGDETRIMRLIVSGADIRAVHTTTKRNALCEASLQGHVNVVDLLLREGCPTDQADTESRTALHHACYSGHLAIAKKLVTANNIDIEASGPQKQTPLHLAVQVPHKNVVMLLLQNHANVNARNDSSQTPLHLSAAKGDAELCSYLLDSGAQLDNRDSKSRTALQVACEAGHYDTAELLLERSSLRATDLTFLTAFFAAVEHGHIRIAESFLCRGLDLQRLGRNDIYKPATLAAKSGSTAMLELMIRKNCNLKAKDDNDWNALHFATRYGHWQLIEPLVAHDVSVKAVTKQKDTPLILAVKYGHFTATEILLRSKGISVTVEDAQEQQPIHHATRAGSFEIFSLLISHGAKVAVENAFGWYPIHIAVAYGHAALVDRLIEQSAKIEEKLGSSSVKKEQTHKMVEDGYWAEARWPYPGSRPLHLACEYGHYQIASVLVSKGAKLEATCSEGWRPLHHAAFNGSSALVELLLSAKCYPWAETEEGHTPKTLQFRVAGSPITQEEKDKISLLLQAAMDRTTKQPGAKGLKAGFKKSRTVEQKQNLIHAAAFSMEMIAMLTKQGGQIHRHQLSHPPMLHSNTYPSALPSVHHPAQAVQPLQSPIPDRPPSSTSNQPGRIVEQTPITESTSSATSSVIALPASVSQDSKSPPLQKITSNTAVTPKSPTTVSSTHSIVPVQALPGMPLNPMKGMLKLKRATTFGGDISKQGMEKLSSGLGSSKQGLEKMSTYSLDASRQGIERVSSGLSSSKQGLGKMSNYSIDVSKQGYKKMSGYGQNMSKQGLDASKQGLEKMKRFSISRGKKTAKTDADGGDGDKDGPFPLSPNGKSRTKDESSTPNSPGRGKKDQGETRDRMTRPSLQGIEELPNDSDSAESIGAFSMGGFEAYDNKVNDNGGDLEGGNVGEDAD